MDENGVNASKLTSDIGINHSSITGWKKGHAKPSYGALVRIANYFNVSVEYLEGKTDDRTPIPFETKNNAAEKFGDAIKRLFIESGKMPEGGEMTDEFYEYAKNLIRAAVSIDTFRNDG